MTNDELSAIEARAANGRCTSVMVGDLVAEVRRLRCAEAALDMQRHALQSAVDSENKLRGAITQALVLLNEAASELTHEQAGEVLRAALGIEEGP